MCDLTPVTPIIWHLTIRHTTEAPYLIHKILAEVVYRSFRDLTTILRI